MGEFLSEGRLGECRFKTGYGEIRLDQAGAVNLTSGSGDVTVATPTAAPRSPPATAR